MTMRSGIPLGRIRSCCATLWKRDPLRIDGISLTVAAVRESSFQVSVIPHTRQVTALVDRAPGDLVNLECDIIGKYVEKLLIQPAAPAKARAEREPYHGRVSETVWILNHALPQPMISGFSSYNWKIEGTIQNERWF